MHAGQRLRRGGQLTVSTTALSAFQPCLFFLQADLQYLLHFPTLFLSRLLDALQRFTLAADRNAVKMSLVACRSHRTD